MTTESGEPSTHEQRVNEAIAAYLAAADAGQEPDRPDFLARHADVADDLAAFFADRDRFRKAAEPLDAAAAAPGGGATIDSNGSATAGTGNAVVHYFGDYELLDEIARGGMGVVYKAKQVSLNRTVALKMILAGQLASVADVQRFRTEAEAAANLRHPGIIAIHEVGEHQGQHYFSMDYIDGRSLADVVRDGPLPAQRAARYVETVATAIQYAHQHGVLHRDLKPSNVLLDATDRPHVTDFGLAKQAATDYSLTATGQVLGTPSYMPPEQATGSREVGPAADIYSLGAILYHLITGRPPFQGETALDTLLQVRETEPVPPRLLNPKVPPELETVCLKCLEKDPRQRYASAGELADDLGRFRAGEPITARPPRLGYVVRLYTRHNFHSYRGLLHAAFLCASMPLLMLLSMAVQLVPVFRLTAESYDRLPGAARPWLATLDWSAPLWQWGLGIVLGLAALTVLGLGLILLPKPRTAAADVAGGVGISLFVWLGTVPAFCLLLSLLVTGPITVAADGMSLLTERGRWVQQYPDLAAVPEAERGRVLTARLSADLVLGVAVVAGKGTIVLLIYVAIVVLAGSIWTGHQQRQLGVPSVLSEGYAPAMLPVVTGFLWLMLIFTQSELRFLEKGRSLLLWIWLPALLAPFGSARGWRWPAQVPLYAAWLYGVARSGGAGVDGIDAAVIVTYCLLAWALGRRRWPDPLLLSPRAAALLALLWALPCTVGVLLHESHSPLRFAWWAFTWAALYTAGEAVSPSVVGVYRRKRDLLTILTIAAPVLLFTMQRHVAGGAVPVEGEWAVYLVSLAAAAACYLRQPAPAAQASV